MPSLDEKFIAALGLVALAASGVVGALGCGGAPAPSTTTMPAKLRSNAVGVTTRTFVDATRPTPANGSAAESPQRSLTSEIWYPTDGDAGADVQRDAALAASGAPYPLLLFVHGSSGNRTQSTFLTTALAGAGYVVLAADFPLTAGTTPGGSSDKHVGDQLQDTIFLADQMGALSTASGEPLHGLCDPSKGYAVIGHSTGGTVTLLTAYAPDVHDTRVRAAVALAPCACFFGDSFFRTRTLPLLVVAGSDDAFVPPSTNGARAYQLAGAPKMMATLIGGQHVFFTDFDLPDEALAPMPTTADADIAQALTSYGGGTACSPIPPVGKDPKLSFDDQHDRTNELVRAFVDDALRGEHGGLTALVAAPSSEVTIARQ